MKTLPSDAVPITLALFLFSKLSKKLKLDIKKRVWSFQNLQDEMTLKISFFSKTKKKMQLLSL